MDTKSHPILNALYAFGELIYKFLCWSGRILGWVVVVFFKYIFDDGNENMVWVWFCLFCSLYCLWKWYSIGIFTMEGFGWGLASAPTTIWGNIAMWKEDGKGDYWNDDRDN